MHYRTEEREPHYVIFESGVALWIALGLALAALLTLVYIPTRVAWW